MSMDAHWARKVTCSGIPWHDLREGRDLGTRMSAMVRTSGRPERLEPVHWPIVPTWRGM